ncbi:hypothetical protein CesoFtcFv8_000956 [Champsocephalus esox]|uniref:Adrenomedullin n=1 Tax=Champsocephalus esox TaxID=159716 RepID=A0AAN8D4U6_9TELE|nr:hypothetical protein CesoFtcFv8_000956 [Champsocephalus esox]
MFTFFSTGVKMQLIFQSFLSCCLLATVAHCVELEVNPELKTKLSTWLGSRLRRDLNSVSVEKTAEYFVRPEDIRDTLLPHSSTHTNVRTKRSKNSSNHSKGQGCSLVTCTVHDLAHRLHMLNNNLKIGTAPRQKISAHGYGRRRRSLPVHRVSLRLEQGRLRPMWSIKDSQVHKLEALLRRT